MADVPSNVDPATKSFLGKEMYLVVTRPVRSPEIAKRLGDHLAHQIELEKRGIMFAAGPLYPRGSETPEAGMFVLRASSFEEAEAIAKEDPLHKAGLRTFTLQKWRVNEGRITVTVDFSDQTMKIEWAIKTALGDVRGSPLSIEFTITPIHSEQGEIIGLVTVMRVVTARFEETKGLRQQLRALTARGATTDRLGVAPRRD